MREAKNNIDFVKRAAQLGSKGTTGVSLHCHTMHSREWLDFVPYYAERIPGVAYFWRRKMRQSMEQFGRLPDFQSGYWSPPLTGTQVFEMETANINTLDLKGMVSITDHDTIDANVELADEVGAANAPISMEWTVPYGDAFFHIGVHNMPPAEAGEISRQLLEYTRAQGEPDNRRLTELLTMMDEIPEMLVVLNHPIWDIEMIGQEKHERALHEFLNEYRACIHAIEVNGFRPWAENQRAIELAEAAGLPLVSGGDRHCLQSNTMLNVTDATSFSEFVSEVRFDKHSQIVVTPDYNVVLPSRQLASIAQIMGNYRDFPEGRRGWPDRIFLDNHDGKGLRSLNDYWNGHIPSWARVALFAVAVMSNPAMRPLISAFVGDNDIGTENHVQPSGKIAFDRYPIPVKTSLVS